MSMKIFMETLQGMRYNLRMTVVPISIPSYIYGGKILDIHNTRRPESTLKNKINYIFYHAACQSFVMGGFLTIHICTNKNCAYLSTKVLYGGKCRLHVSNLLYNIYDYL